MRGEGDASRAAHVASHGRGAALTCGAAGLRGAWSGRRANERGNEGASERVLRQGAPGGRALPAELQPRPQPCGAALLRLLPALCVPPVRSVLQDRTTASRSPHRKRVTSEVAAKQDFVFQERSRCAVQADLELAGWIMLASNSWSPSYLCLLILNSGSI